MRSLYVSAVWEYRCQANASPSPHAHTPNMHVFSLWPTSLFPPSWILGCISRGRIASIMTADGCWLLATFSAEQRNNLEYAHFVWLGLPQQTSSLPRTPTHRLANVYDCVSNFTFAELLGPYGSRKMPRSVTGLISYRSPFNLSYASVFPAFQSGAIFGLVRYLFLETKTLGRFL